MKFITGFIFFWAVFAPVDPDPIRIRTRIRIRIHNTGLIVLILLSRRRRAVVRGHNPGGEVENKRGHCVPQDWLWFPQFGRPGCVWGTTYRHWWVEFFLIGRKWTNQCCEIISSFLLPGFFGPKVAKIYSSKKVLHKIAIGTVFISHNFVKGCEL